MNVNLYIKKKHLLIVLVLILFTNSINGADIGIFLKGGCNFSKNIGNDVSEEIQTIVVPAVAFGLRANIIDMFAIQPEVMYSVKGSKIESDGIIANTFLHYLEIPILFKLTPSINSKFYPSIFVGPALGINTVADIKVDGNSSKSDETDIYKDIDFGITMGAGFDFKIKSSRVIIDIRYNLGLLNIYDLAFDYSFKNSVVSFMLGYEFDF